MPIIYQVHPDPDVKNALIKLSDALAKWERNSSSRSILILREINYCYRARLVVFI